MHRMMSAYCFVTYVVLSGSALVNAQVGVVKGWCGGDCYGADATPIVPGSNPPRTEKFTAVSVGPFFNLGLRPDGSIRGWGTDTQIPTVGFFGTGVLEDLAPNQGQLFPPPGRKFVDVSAGFTHAVALLDDGSIFIWGDDQNNGEYRHFCLPTLPTGVTYLQVGAGEYYTVALLSNRQLVGWGLGASPPVGLNCSNEGVPSVVGS